MRKNAHYDGVVHLRMRKIFKKILIGTTIFIVLVPIVFIVVLVVGLYVTSSGDWDELELSPIYTVKLGWVADLEDWDLKYTVYKNGKKVFTSASFYIQYPPIKPEYKEFGYYHIEERYFAIFNTYNPHDILIIIDAEQGIYGKKDRSCFRDYHEDFNNQMIDILKKFRQHLQNDNLYLDSSHYNCTRSSEFIR